MILSHRHKFIFIKGQKVAGTSVEVALSQVCGPDDIITPITAVDEKLRLGTRGSARNYDDDPAIAEQYIRNVAELPPEKVARLIPRKTKFKNHMSLRQVRGMVPEAADYRILFAERSPYEKVLSAVNWWRSIKTYAKGGELEQSTDGLVEALQKAIDEGELSTARNIRQYREEDGSLPAKGWRYETLAQELEEFFRELGETPVPMPDTKKGLQMKTDEVIGLITPEQLAYINEFFAEEFEAFGYAKIDATDEDRRS